MLENKGSFLRAHWPWLAALGVLLLVLFILIGVYKNLPPDPGTATAIAAVQNQTATARARAEATYAAIQTQDALGTAEPVVSITPAVTALPGSPTATLSGAVETPPGMYPPPVAPASPAPYPSPVIQPSLTSQPTDSSYPNPLATTPAVSTPAGYPSPGGQGTTQATTLPTASLTPTITQIPGQALPCNLAEFVADATIPDGTLVYPNQLFTKAWTVRNGGSCTWNTGYALVFESGDQMDAKPAVPFTRSVPPNTFTDLSITFDAPLDAGLAKSFWMLRSDNGEVFGTGVTRDQPMWVRVEVRAPNPNVAFDMQNALCRAVWRSRAGVLPCPGDTAFSGGSITPIEEPILENGANEDEPAFYTRTGTLLGAFMYGTFPLYTVQAGDRFMADVGCPADFKECKVSIAIGYVESTSSPVVRNLLTIEEKWDEKMTRIDIDLAALVGKEIHLVLTVRNLGRADQAGVIWLVPGIRNTQ
jgi:hypothetical protein